MVKSYLQKIHVKRKLLDVQYSFNQCFHNWIGYRIEKVIGSLFISWTDGWITVESMTSYIYNILLKLNNIYNIIYSYLYKCINDLNLLNKIYTIFKYENILKIEKICIKWKKSNCVIIYIYIIFWNSLSSCFLLGF